jgi:D-alanyl-D-alanine carboxypeptidase
MKTGSTKEAGNCLLAAFEKDGRQIIVGIFGAESKTERYEDALRLLEICTQPTR